LRNVGIITSATAPPISAVNNWGQEKVAGSAVSIGGFIVPDASRLSERTPQMIFTTIRYTLEGNFGDSCQQSCPLGYYQILGYGIPEY
jgi:hypothetical protein